MENSETQASNKAPTHIAYQVADGSTKSYWTRIGAAWTHKDGYGIHLQLDAIPLDGAIVLRTVTDNK